MKLVTAVIRPEKLGDVRQALEAAGVQGLTISEASGFGRQKGEKQVYRGATFTTNLVPKLKLEILVVDENVSRVVTAILDVTSQGTAGDGKVWVTAVESVIRVSDRSEGLAAL
ncbi:P-II family nitrogen regulator [Brevibacterium sp. 50QC2O2]|jgi:nitrogen regulatory protein P-II 1|uniref:P-II family nitrogen regulator n=1 Tax=Brevibacterium TaxID=1696 RepID=UPI00211CBA76|nr:MULTISPECIES: P-II family nitrogen regulator [unclassified Brevibacterium]MCQ9367785.1 P-II family nitrogen regulator [Brevibacterium sp. 91QC2O2]MCQ9384909.1 P-II family nitrogen regulator [Brevibacterium sp. 68QC2CO]MCQ9388044.1 P-II family nitrogen regulator [Brevibacterium sp. 50QC2O2]